MSDMNEVNKTNNSAGSGFTNTDQTEHTQSGSYTAGNAETTNNAADSRNSQSNDYQTGSAQYNAGSGQNNGYQNGQNNGYQNGQGNGYQNSQNNGYQNGQSNNYQNGQQQAPHYGNYQFHTGGPNPQGPYDFGQSYGAGGPIAPKPKKDHKRAKKVGVFIGKTAAAALIASVVFTGVFAVAQHTGLISVGGRSADSSESQDFSSEYGMIPNMPDFGSGNGSGSSNGSGDNGSTDSSASDQSASGPTLGIKAQTVSSDQTSKGYPEGVLVVSVTSGSAADEAGLEKGDVITAFNGSMVDSVEDLKQLLAEAETGKEYKLNYKRADGSSYKAYSTNVTFSDSSDSDSSSSK